MLVEVGSMAVPAPVDLRGLAIARAHAAPERAKLDWQLVSHRDGFRWTRPAPSQVGVQSTICALGVDLGRLINVVPAPDAQTCMTHGCQQKAALSAAEASAALSS